MDDYNIKIKIAEIFAKNKEASVLCPVCNQEHLTTTDATWKDKTDRYISCPTGHFNITITGLSTDNN